MKRVDGYLSRKAQAAWPTAVVYCDEEPQTQRWTLEREGVETVGLGSSFGAARGALYALIAAERNK